jgi:type IV pilus assembly protein PilY1
VGALGSGGRGLFALDVTEPPQAATDGTNAAELAAAPKVLWEFNAEDDVGLGYVLGKPVIRKMNDGRWAAIVSGGYNNSEVGTTQGDGKAYLFIIYLNGPTGNNGRTWRPGIDYVRLDTGTGTVVNPNGLAAPFTADMNVDGKVDYIYAGDLLGTFWKFDVTLAPSEGIGVWSGANRRVALFTGSANQPITGAAEGGLHPTGRGLILMFGTGKYLEPSDPVAAVVTPTVPTPYKKQSFYGIWDKNDSKDISKQTTVTGTTNLFEQTINVVAAASGTYRYMSGPTTGPRNGATGPDWTTDLGWFMDFPDSAQTGERNVAAPLLVSRRLIFTTILPGTGACDGGGKSFLMVVNPGTGGGFTSAIIDTNGDGVLNAADAVSEGVFATGVLADGIVSTPALFSGSGTRADSTLLNSDNIGRVSGGTLSQLKKVVYCTSKGTCPPGPNLGFYKDDGRATWREVVKK